MARRARPRFTEAILLVSKDELTLGQETKDRAVLWNVTQRSCVDAHVAGMVHESLLTAAQKLKQLNEGCTASFVTPCTSAA